MVMIVSTLSASAAGVAATLAPAAATSRVLSGVRFHTVSSWPRPIRRCAMAAPIRPVPAIPTFIPLLLFRLRRLTRAATARQTPGGMSKARKSEIRDGMQIDWDVPVRMDDGLVLRADVFRPARKGRYPVLVTYGPYAKGLAFQDGYPSAWQRMVAEHPDVAYGSSNLYQSWELVDPEKWVPAGYACLRVDSRGAGRSPGFIDPFSPRETRDLYDCIEWAGVQPWSSGKVGLNGISYYAMNQWHVATLQPPHLAAMCVWEGSADWYRDMTHHGGIVNTFFA